MNEVAPKKKGLGKILGLGCLGVVGIFVGLGLLGAIVGDKDAAKSGGPVSADNSDAAVTAAAPAAAEPEEPASNLTGPQQNAVRTAKDYLDMSGFSRKGLIGQLSSEYGSGYSVTDATAAVDSLNVDWNEQAARSAKDYLDMSGFSCKGLIEQLSSDAGSKYTVSEATFGAKQAGAC